MSGSTTTVYPAGSPQAQALDQAGFADPSKGSITANGQSYGPLAISSPGSVPGRSWLSQLQPASWRGLPFGVLSSEYRRGRRFAVHEYPYRPLPWAEDIGRASRGVAFSGFVVGDDCYKQAQALLAASEVKGAGTLVHPSLGTMTVALVAPLTGGERTELGRVVELRFEFVETLDPSYPATTISTQSDVATKAMAAQAASAADFKTAAGQNAPGPSLGPSVTNPPEGLQASPATTYTDSRGTVTLVPANTGDTSFQSSNGTSTVSLFGTSASAQASDPGLTAGATAGLTPPGGMTYSRFDAPAAASTASAAPAAAPAATPQAALDNQVQSNAAVIASTNDALASIGVAI